MDRVDAAVLLAVVAVLAAVTLPRLPPGVCFGDSGDLQISSATLGIAHPPGYPVLVSLGFILTLLPFIQPAYVISLACLASGLLAIGLCGLLQVRLGVNRYLAGGVMLMLAAHPSVWRNLGSPEVYGPALAFMAAGCYLLIKFAAQSRRRDLLLASFLLGCLLATRPPALLMMPGAVVCWWMAHRRLGCQRRQTLRSALSAIAFLAIPSVYSLAYLWVRDNPGTIYNYIDLYNAEHGSLPEVEEGFGAKMARVRWQAGARQYRGLIHRTRGEVRSKMKWTWNQLSPDFPFTRSGKLDAVTLPAGALFLALGGFVGYRRSPGGVWVLGGVGLGAAAFVLAYRAHDPASDLMPILFVVAVLSGLALSPLLPGDAAGWRLWVVRILFLAAGVWTFLDAPSRRSAAGGPEDASAFIDGAGLAALPAGAVIFSDWGTTPPLLYALRVSQRRSDVSVSHADSGRWMDLAMAGLGAGVEAGAVFFTRIIELPPGYELSPAGTLWRLVESPDR